MRHTAGQVRCSALRHGEVLDQRVLTASAWEERHGESGEGRRMQNKWEKE